MKLYCSPGALSLAPQIAFHEAGIVVETVGVDLVGRITADGRDFDALSPLGQVPLLELDDGSTLREAAVILRFAAALAPSAELAPPCDGASCESLAALRLSEWLHGGVAGLDMDCPSAARYLGWIDTQLAPGRYLCGSRFTIADIYTWVLLAKGRSSDDGAMACLADGAARFRNIETWHMRIAARPSVLRARADERRLRTGSRSLPLAR